MEYIIPTSRTGDLIDNGFGVNFDIARLVGIGVFAFEIALLQEVISHFVMKSFEAVVHVKLSTAAFYRFLGFHECVVKNGCRIQRSSYKNTPDSNDMVATKCRKTTELFSWKVSLSLFQKGACSLLKIVCTKTNLQRPLFQLQNRQHRLSDWR